MNDTEHSYSLQEQERPFGFELLILLLVISIKPIIKTLIKIDLLKKLRLLFSGALLKYNIMNNLPAFHELLYQWIEVLKLKM